MCSFLIISVCLVFRTQLQNFGDGYYFKIAFELPKAIQKKGHNSYEIQLKEFQNHSSADSWYFFFFCKLHKCHDTLVCIKLLFTDYTDSHVLNAKFLHYSMAIKVASKVFLWMFVHSRAVKLWCRYCWMWKHVEWDDEWRSN